MEQAPAAPQSAPVSMNEPTRPVYTPPPAPSIEPVVKVETRREPTEPKND
jgi:hypothetical protein